MSYLLPKFLQKNNKLPWIIIFIGIALRFVRYLHNPSLWFDEAIIGVDIINRSLSELIHASPTYNVSLPYGFLILEKLAIQTFGNYEFVFRLFPLLSGVLSIFLFYEVAKRFIKPKAVSLALGIFVISDLLVHFSSELKPYSSDVTIALLIFLIASHIRSKSLKASYFILFGITGAILIWFSNPSVFVLAGVGMTLFISSIFKKDWLRCRGIVIVCLIWVISFAFYYFIFLQNLIGNESLQSVWELEGSFAPLPPTSLSDIKWFFTNFFQIFYLPVGFPRTGLAAFVFLVGCISIFPEKKERFFILLSPIFFALIASGFHKYVIYERSLLFFAPSVILFVAEGVEQIRDKIKNNTAIIIILVGLLLVHPLYMTGKRLINPPSRQEIKPFLNYIKDNWQEGDILYIYYKGEYQFEYYAKHYPEKSYNFNENEYIIGIAPESWYGIFNKQLSAGYSNKEKTDEELYNDFKASVKKDVDKLREYKRAWVLFSAPGQKGIAKFEFYFDFLDKIGKMSYSQVDFRTLRLEPGIHARAGIVAVYLYNLNTEAGFLNRLNIKG